MTARLLYRITAVVLVLFAAGHIRLSHLPPIVA
jgi:succinate dehydrogenase hydrophobic anchor subunit